MLHRPIFKIKKYWWNSYQQFGVLGSLGHILCQATGEERKTWDMKRQGIDDWNAIMNKVCDWWLISQSVQPMDLPKSGNCAPAIFMVFTAGLKCWEGYQAHGNLAQCSQKRLVIDFIWYFLQFFLWLQPWLHLDIQVKYFVSSYDKYYENLTKISFWARCSWEQIFKIGIFEVASGFGIFKQNRNNPDEIGMVGHSDICITRSVRWAKFSWFPCPDLITVCNEWMNNFIRVSEVL